MLQVPYFWNSWECVTVEVKVNAVQAQASDAGPLMFYAESSEDQAQKKEGISGRPRLSEVHVEACELRHTVKHNLCLLAV